jgi:hypothetical protein
LEIHCAESPQLDYRNWPDDKIEEELDWLASAEPTLYCQMLPLPDKPPEELVGHTFAFRETPHDDPAEWDRGVGWLFFVLYLFEHDCVYPTTITFTERQGNRYRVTIVSSYPLATGNYELRIDAWLDWEG